MDAFTIHRRDAGEMLPGDRLASGAMSPVNVLCVLARHAESLASRRFLQTSGFSRRGIGGVSRRSDAPCLLFAEFLYLAVSRLARR